MSEPWTHWLARYLTQPAHLFGDAKRHQRASALVADPLREARVFSEVVIENVRPEIRDEVIYAMSLAAETMAERAAARAQGLAPCPKTKTP